MLPELLRKLFYLDFTRHELLIFARVIHLSGVLMLEDYELVLRHVARRIQERQERVNKSLYFPQYNEWCGAVAQLTQAAVPPAALTAFTWEQLVDSNTAGQPAAVAALPN